MKGDGTLISEFPAPRTIKNEFSLFISYLVCGISIQKPKQTNTNSPEMPKSQARFGV